MLAPTAQQRIGGAYNVASGEVCTLGGMAVLLPAATD